MNEILDGVLEYFKDLARIPRPSGHEKAVSDHLYREFSKIGCSVRQDEVNNIIADLPASAGLEKAPLVALQGHMDMVCVAAEGVSYDPLHDPVILVRTDEYLMAQGTSLGSDDGIGVAEILYIMKNIKRHGPLRAIITVDEEVGMKGASALDKQYLTDVKYLINCDSEDYDVLTVGCAGSVNMDFSLPVSWKQADYKETAWCLSVRGLLGGHSGERIADGRANAIKLLADILSLLRKAGYLTAVSRINGGAARNAIPAEAEAVFVSAADKAQLNEAVNICKEKFMKVFAGIEAEPLISLQQCKPAELLIDNAALDALLNLIKLLHSGVFAMSASIPGMVETSANLGMLRTERDEICVTYFPRSSIAEKLLDFVEQGRILAELTGFTIKAGGLSPAWHENKSSRLVKLMAEIFAEQNGRTMQITAIHAGLECGYHIEKNSQLDMVSIGVTTKDIHSPRERLVLASVAPQVKLIQETLQRIINL